MAGIIYIGSAMRPVAFLLLPECVR